jgi:hypothetical protein
LRVETGEALRLGIHVPLDTELIRGIGLSIEYSIRYRKRQE